MFSIKIIEHKKYLVGKGINADGKFLSVISKEGDILTLLENGRWSVACINQYISSNATVFNGACVYKFLTTMIKTVEVPITHFVPIYYLGKKN